MPGNFTSTKTDPHLRQITGTGIWIESEKCTHFNSKINGNIEIDFKALLTNKVNESIENLAARGKP